MKSYNYPVTLIKVIDGDTVDLLVDLGFSTLTKQRFRLYGINAPESRTKNLKEKEAGIASSVYLHNTLQKADSIIIETIKDKKGKYGRYLCKIYINGNKTSVNKNMIENKLAVPYIL